MIIALLQRKELKWRRLEMRIKVLVVLLVVLLLVGCNSQQPAAQQNFKQGVKEVQFSFFEGTPPAELFGDTPFTIVVEVENPMGYDAENGDVTLVGLDKKFFFLQETKKLFPASAGVLEGKSETNPAGDRVFLQFNGRTGTLAQNVKEHENNLLLEAHYTSRMEFKDDVCLNPRLYDVHDAGCDVKARKSYSGQGAPLGVTAMEQVTYPGDSPEIELRLDLRNRGRGRIKEVTIGSARLGGKEISCQFKQFGENKKKALLKPSKQEAKVVCRSRIDSYNSYSTPLFIEFDYDYEFTLRKKITLKK